MIQYSKIYRIYCPNEYSNGGLRDGYTEEIDDMVASKLSKEITLEDYKNLNACLVNDSVFIRDDGRKAKRVFDMLNQYYHVVMEEVSYDIIMENSYIKIEKTENPIDESKYNMYIWRKIEEYPKEMFRKFRLDITSTDDVLDKIISKGIDYLDDIDKEILKNKKPS